MKTISALAACAALAVSASAAAAPVSGARVEALIGVDRVSLDLGDVGFEDETSGEGLVFGLGVGYDFAVGPRTAIGIDLEASTTPTGQEFKEGDLVADISFTRDLYAGAQLTTSVSESVNLFFRAGYTNQRVRITATDEFDIFSGSDNLDGVRGGAGLQFALGASAYVGAEYRYSNYEADITRHQAVASLGFRF